VLLNKEENKPLLHFRFGVGDICRHGEKMKGNMSQELRKSHLEILSKKGC